ncbi:MAG: putative selenium-dependent hydroxylase accessory protein YqeC [Treponema sp.]|jgi:probable selenium-dependent hydroxylase accessory protein YqeC|nr:putative selenium-dependent hydroxylase accessory protein YqeC [Treponema sp.]
MEIMNLAGKSCPMNEALHTFFERDAPGRPIITVIGSGGKTSLIWYLARKMDRLCTLVTTTTKMGVPPPGAKRYDHFLKYESPTDASQVPAPGVTLAVALDASGGKLVALPPEALEAMVRQYDYVLIEGDGSRQLPLKAWAAYEPVVPAYTTLTVGILPLWPVGMIVSQTIIHRLPLFSTLTGLGEGEVLSLGALVPVLTGGNSALGKGLFSAAQGKRVLFFNQIEDEKALDQARELLSLLPRSFLETLSMVIAGSVRQERAVLLWRAA